MNRADLNQSTIVRSLRMLGASVHITSQVGNGFPDIVVGWFGKNFLFEIKNKDTFGKLNTLQLIFRDRWKGTVSVVESFDDTLKIINH